MRSERRNGYATLAREALTPPRGIAARVRATARGMTLSGLGALASPRQDAFLRCIYCHYVFDDQVDRFRRILEDLKRTGEFVDTDACVSMLTGETPIDGRYYHLSFDDGFRNLYTNAAPVLVDLGIPAIVFVPTAYVGADFETARRYCLDVVGASGVVEMLGWEDLRELRRAGIETGSHTRTHARFTTLRTDAARDEEIGGSKRDLEARLGAPCNYIAWPFGKRADVDAASLEATRRIGYRACFGAFRGSINPTERVDLFSIPRHHFEVQWPLGHVRYFAYGMGE